MNDSIIILPKKLSDILLGDQKIYVQFLGIISPFSDILKEGNLFFFPEYTDHGINHIQKTLQYVENLIADDAFSNLTALEAGVILLSVILHDIGMHTNAEMFKNMIDGRYDDLAVLSPNSIKWCSLWRDYLYDSQYWSEEKKKTVFGDPNYIIRNPDLSNLQELTGYDRKLIGEFLRKHHCRIAQEIALKGYIGRNTIQFGLNDSDSWEYVKIAGIVAKSHGMDIRDTFDYLESQFGDTYTPLGIHVVYLMVLLRLADYLHIDSTRTNNNILNINTTYSPFSLQEHKTHLSIKNIQFINRDKERIVIQATPQDAQTYVKIENLVNEIQKEFDRSWAILGEAYSDNSLKLRFRRITTNISNDKFKIALNYVPQQFGFKYNNDLFKLLISPLYGENPSYGVRELVQNAVDACRLCINDIPNDGEPHVRVEIDSQNSLFTIVDRGKGMNLYEIRNYFLTIGSSYNDNIDWQKKRDQEHLYRAGRFGIGILAAFLLGPKISVITRKRGEDSAYKFSASIHDTFIQIDKVHNVEYGTRIDIECTESCLDTLKKKDNLYCWYTGECPKVMYFIDGELKYSSCLLPDYRELKHSSDTFGTVYWKPTLIEEIFARISLYPHETIRIKGRPLYCNGFRICKKSHKRLFSLIGFEQFQHIIVPSLQITDIYNRLPLNLQRNNIEEDVQFEFEPELAKVVFIDLMCQLMATDIKSIQYEYYNFHADGFSLQSEYINNHLKENKILNLPNSYHRFSRDNETNKLFELLRGTDYIIRFCLIEETTKRKRYTHSQESIAILKTINKVFPDKPILGISISSINKADSKQHTILDDLFEKYMGSDPIIPYTMKGRKKKFPSLFHDYIELINYYLNRNKCCPLPLNECCDRD